MSLFSKVPAPDGGYNVGYPKSIEQAAAQAAYYGSRGFDVLIQDTDPQQTGEFFIGRYALWFFGDQEHFFPADGAARAVAGAGQRGDWRGGPQGRLELKSP
jgi:hypothetical protein